MTCLLHLVLKVHLTVSPGSLGWFILFSWFTWPAGSLGYVLLVYLAGALG